MYDIVDTYIYTCVHLYMYKSTGPGTTITCKNTCVINKLIDNTSVLCSKCALLSINHNLRTRVFV